MRSTGATVVTDSGMLAVWAARAAAEARDRLLWTSGRAVETMRRARSCRHCPTPLPYGGVTLDGAARRRSVQRAAAPPHGRLGEVCGRPLVACRQLAGRSAGSADVAAAHGDHPEER